MAGYVDVLKNTLVRAEKNFDTTRAIYDLLLGGYERNYGRNNEQLEAYEERLDKVWNILEKEINGILQTRAIIKKMERENR